MKASALSAAHIGVTVYLPETEDTYAVIGRLDAIVLGPRSPEAFVTLWLGGLECAIPADVDVELIQPSTLVITAPVQP